MPCSANWLPANRSTGKLSLVSATWRQSLCCVRMVSCQLKRLKPLIKAQPQPLVHTQHARSRKRLFPTTTSHCQCQHFIACSSSFLDKQDTKYLHRSRDVKLSIGVCMGSEMTKDLLAKRGLAKATMPLGDFKTRLHWPLQKSEAIDRHAHGY